MEDGKKTFEKIGREIAALLRVDKSLKKIMRASVSVIRQLENIDAFGLRIKSENDYPYYYSNGFHKDFMEREQFICCSSAEGVKESRCLCLNLLESSFSADSPFLSKGGSFLTNSITLLYNSLGEEGKELFARGACRQKGYESLALIPIYYSGARVGLIQVNDSRVELFKGYLIDFFESYSSLLSTFLEYKFDYKSKNYFAFEELDLELVKEGDAFPFKLGEKHFHQSKELFIERCRNIDLSHKKGESSSDEREILTLCCQCKMVRNDKGDWVPIEKFIHETSRYNCSHSFCPDCYEKWLEEIG